MITLGLFALGITLVLIVLFSCLYGLLAWNRRRKVTNPIVWDTTFTGPEKSDWESFRPQDPNSRRPVEKALALPPKIQRKAKALRVNPMDLKRALERSSISI